MKIIFNGLGKFLSLDFVESFLIKKYGTGFISALVGGILAILAKNHATQFGVSVDPVELTVGLTGLLGGAVNALINWLKHFGQSGAAAVAAANPTPVPAAPAGGAPSVVSSPEAGKK